MEKSEPEGETAGARPTTESQILRPAAIGQPDRPLRPADIDGWKILHFGSDNDPFWRFIRTAYISYIGSHLPVSVLSGVVQVAIWVWMFSGRVYWHTWAVVGLTFVTILLSWWQYGGERGRTCKECGSRRTSAWALAKQLSLGILWGGLFLHLILIAETAQIPVLVLQGIIVTTIAAFINSIMPLGMLSFHLPVTIGLAAGLLLRAPPYYMESLLLLGLYTLLLMRSTWISTTSFFANVGNRFRLTEQKEVVRLLLNEFETNGEEWLFEIDREGRLVFASPRFAEVAGRPISDMLGKHWQELVPRTSRNAAFYATAFRSQAFRDMLLETTVNGERRWWQLSGTPKIDRNGRIEGWRGVGVDCTERQRAAHRIAELASFDALTGLANRRVIHDTLMKGLARPEGVSLLFVDLDRFKSVNDTFGHSSGDTLLAVVAQDLREVCRQHLGDRAVVGRLGGDEFAIILRACDRSAAEALGEAVVKRISAPHVVAGKQVMIGASVGFALGPKDGATVELLMRAADMALYAVKRHGRGQVRAFDADMVQQMNNRQDLEQALRFAERNGEFHLLYQPIVNALDEKIVSFEALLRWQNPVHGHVSPALFIPIAEESDLIVSIGRWVLNEACRVAGQWPEHVRVAVNVSSRQLEDEGFVAAVAAALAGNRLSPGRLELELTESLFLDERPQTVRTLAGLKALGIHFALDDFGTGYASLGYLHRIAFSRLKIDRSFVENIDSHDEHAMTIVQSIVALAEHLGMQTTAEGAETRGEFEAVRRLGCTQVQGFYFSRPVSAEDAARLLETRQPLIKLDDAPPTPSADGGQSQFRAEVTSLRHH